jgi:hypothetical protein
MMKYHNQSDEQLIKTLDGLVGRTGVVVKQCCEIFVELIDKRGNTTRRPQGVYMYYRKIASGALNATFVLMFMGKPVMNYIDTLSIEQQLKMVEDDSIEIVEMKNDGVVVPVKKHIRRMAKREVDLVFSDKGIRSVAEQKKVFKARNLQQPRKHRTSELVIKADPAKGEIIIGQIRINPMQLNTALAELGFAPVTRLAPARRAA